MLKEKMRADVLYITVSQHDLGIFWGAKLGSPGCSWKMASRGCSDLTTSPEMMEIVGEIIPTEWILSSRFQRFISLVGSENSQFQDVSGLSFVAMVASSEALGTHALKEKTFRTSSCSVLEALWVGAISTQDLPEKKGYADMQGTILDGH